MFCRNCGKSVDDQAVACMSCGVAPANGHRFWPESGGAMTNPAAIMCVKCGVPLRAPSFLSSGNQAIFLGLNQTWADRLHHPLARLHPALLAPVRDGLYARATENDRFLCASQLARRACGLFHRLLRLECVLARPAAASAIALSSVDWGLPCPTTGLTRSLLCLVHGDWRQSLRWAAAADGADPRALRPQPVVAGRVSGGPAARPPARQFFSRLGGPACRPAWACKLLGSASYW